MHRGWFIYSLLAVLLCTCTKAPVVPQQRVTNVAELQQALANAAGPVNIYLESGDYELASQAVNDSACGNCEDPAQVIPVTAGLLLSGPYIQLSGPPDHSARLITNAGYGLYFRDCEEGIVENLTITGGQRTADNRATDAAIVAQNSRVTIQHNRIVDNIGDSATVAKTIVGIAGISGRENAELTITNNEILRNSWDGIALYRDAQAEIHRNLIDGIDRASGSTIGGGRGVAIGITWNASARVRQNLLRNYWKGLGIFVDAQVTAEDNIVEHMRTWGISYWDAGRGMPVGHITGNAVYGCGACGVALAREKAGPDPGELRGNIIVRTGQDSKYDSPELYCSQCALSVAATPENFVIDDNLFSQNRRASEDLPDYDITLEALSHRLPAVHQRLKNNPYYGRSEFYKFVKMVIEE